MSDGIENKAKAAAAEQARRVKFLLPGNVVNQATVDLPPDQRGALRWVHDHAAALGLDIAEAAQLLDLEPDALSAIWQGKYAGPLAPVVRRIEDRKAHWEKLTSKAGRGEKLGFIETSLATDLWKVCDAARKYHKWAFIFGDTQAGKTTALEAYGGEHCPKAMQLPHGTVVCTRMPVGGSLPHYLAELARHFHISTQLKQYTLMHKLTLAFDPSMLLIVDEAHQCMLGRKQANALRTIEFIRELADRRGCGVVVSATNVFQDAMADGPLVGILKQCSARQIVSKQIDPPTEADLNTFAAAYGLPPATDKALKLQTKTVTSGALGLWLTLLQMAANIARSKNQPLAWEGVLRADIGLKALAGKKDDTQDGGGK